MKVDIEDFSSEILIRILLSPEDILKIKSGNFVHWAGIPKRSKEDEKKRISLLVREQDEESDLYFAQHTWFG